MRDRIFQTSRVPRCQLTSCVVVIVTVGVFGYYRQPLYTQLLVLVLKSLRHVSPSHRGHNVWQEKLTVIRRESFENIYLDLSKQPGKCKLAESGLGWRPAGGGDTFTLDSNNIGVAQWSRAAKGHELKILSRSSGVIQLDGFDQEVSALTSQGPVMKLTVVTMAIA